MSPAEKEAVVDAQVFSAPLNAWSRTSFQLYAILLVAALNATASGFDGVSNGHVQHSINKVSTAETKQKSIFSSINAMPQYQTYFNHNELGSSTGLIFMMFTVGSIVGSLFTGPICDNFGRRVGMASGSVLIITGAAVQTAAKGDASLLAGRFVLGFGVAIGTSSAPTYALELAPPQWRARIVGYYNTFFYSGSILSTGVAYASSKSPGELAFRLPLSLQILFPLFIVVGTLFIPESPRWLTMWGNKDEAARILAKYHGGGDANHPLVRLELHEFEANIELQKTSTVWNYWALVDTPNARWRFAMMAFMSLFAQLSGNSVLTYYLPSMYKMLGITSTERRLLLTFINSLVSCIGAVAGSASGDRMGRRSKLWVGSFVLAGLLGAVTGFSSQFGDEKKVVGVNLSNGGVAFIFLFGFVYSFVYTPLSSTYCAEVLTNPTRAKGMGVHVLLSNVANLYNAYVTAIALEAIDWRYYLVFVGLNMLYGIIWYAFGVETRGRTLEELDSVFDAKYPPRAALQKRTCTWEVKE
ncbi:hypothetical protein L249_6660 [Ophiocordyceps polyrhachis-furcata BCC 54312]|uniref:Major facilitator superfamily (MFS) profile domain-containing protein n=1 Tax=Ophiocordyceps polyrhachis-furcata BCC 54312 TaxID=1330021 RepID=A0A367LJA7_9HYPO|nr:hypothetical protein L249_6660 [Ophiocordyceps polyrhachis-furcata BCC 54312]